MLAIAALVCIAVGAGAAGALNMWYDADIDARMARTAARPVPKGRISPDEARTFGAILAVGSVICMGLMLNWVAAGLLALTIAFYVFVYTMWLKRWTPQNIVIGGAAGAVPPMIGWAAATGTVSLESFVLFLIIFMWTPPHFWALALVRVRDYERAGVPMLPVVRGEDETRRQILIYSLILAPLGCVPGASRSWRRVLHRCRGLPRRVLRHVCLCLLHRADRRRGRARRQESLRLFRVVPVPVVRSASGGAGLWLEP